MSREENNKNNKRDRIKGEEDNENVEISDNDEIEGEDSTPRGIKREMSDDDLNDSKRRRSEYEEKGSHTAVIESIGEYVSDDSRTEEIVDGERTDIKEESESIKDDENEVVSDNSQTAEVSQVKSESDQESESDSDSDSDSSSGEDDDNISDNLKTEEVAGNETNGDEEIVPVKVEEEEGWSTNKRKKNKKSRNRKNKNEAVDGEELLMHTYHTLPRNCKKFWGRRYKLFSRFDDGIYMTSELWYSVTPESIAQFSASLIKYLLPDCNNILDVCCGGGGNTIQFAYLFDNVGGIDIKDINVQCTVHNAEVYEVADRIWTHVGDWNEMSAEGDDESVSTSWIPEHLRKSEDIDTTFDMIFCSPPWGGTSYNRGSNEFDLYQMEPFAIDKLLESMLQYTQNIALFLPKSSNLDQLREVTKRYFGTEACCRIIYIKSSGYRVGILAMFGKDLPTNYIDYDEFFRTEMGYEPEVEGNNNDDYNGAYRYSDYDENERRYSSDSYDSYNDENPQYEGNKRQDEREEDHSDAYYSDNGEYRSPYPEDMDQQQGEQGEYYSDEAGTYYSDDRRSYDSNEYDDYPQSGDEKGSYHEGDDNQRYDEQHDYYSEREGQEETNENQWDSRSRSGSYSSGYYSDNNDRVQSEGVEYASQENNPPQSQEYEQYDDEGEIGYDHQHSSEDLNHSTYSNANAKPDPEQIQQEENYSEEQQSPYSDDIDQEQPQSDEMGNDSDLQDQSDQEQGYSDQPSPQSVQYDSSVADDDDGDGNNSD